ncbi:MAG: hypothetical protein IPM52_13685 [Bacteroidetes bacterium]|nr:hypothetical protein [Bacteroidota bacterium]
MARKNSMTGQTLMLQNNQNARLLRNSMLKIIPANHALALHRESHHPLPDICFRLALPVPGLYMFEQNNQNSKIFLRHRQFSARNQHSVVYQLNIYFIGDKSVSGPESKQEWENALKVLKLYLGVTHHKLSKYMADVFIYVNQLEQ